MGQHPSKHRSYTPGQDLKAEIPSTAPAHGDLKIDVTVNGGLREHREVPEPSSPTSITSTSSTGKTEKRRRLRFIGFPIRRTPSGRWTRKRRSLKANGTSTRPMSCPVPSLTKEGETTIPRPQSLFAHEFEVHEGDGDGKVETVDLSDNEEAQAKQEYCGNAPIPKPREKKAQRMSKEKAENKKKKRDKKKDQKKDKDMKRTSVDSHTFEGMSNSKNEDTVEEQADTTMLETQRMEEVDISNQELPKGSTDLASMAAFLAQETVNNARQRLLSEQTILKDVFNSETNKAEIENEVPQPISLVTTNQEVKELVETSESKLSSAEGNALIEAIEEDIIPAKAPEKNKSIPVPLHLDCSVENGRKGDREMKEITYDISKHVVGSSLKEASCENMDETEMAGIETSVSNASEDQATEVTEEIIIEQKVDKVKMLPSIDRYISAIPKSNESLRGKTIDNVEDNSVATINVKVINEKTETISEIKKEEACSVPETDGILSTTSEHVIELQAENSSAFASTKTTSSSIAKPSIQNIGHERFDEIKKNFDKKSSDTQQKKGSKTKSSKEQKDKEPTEEKELHLRQRREEKAKEREHVLEEKRKKANEKVIEKAKTKGDRKSLPQRISSWFKKDKFGTASNSSKTPRKLSDPADEAVPNSSEPPEGVSASSRIRQSLTVDVSIQPYAASRDIGICKSSPNPSPTEDYIEPDRAQISPISEANVSLNTDSVSLVFPSSGDAEVDYTEGAPGALKKINLGPRLRTAILRKKSSNASNSGQEDKRVSLTQPKSVETFDITPPPRKFRQRKAAEQYTPVTEGAHNPPKIQSSQLNHLESKEASSEKIQMGIMETNSLPSDFKTIINMDDNTKALSFLIGKNVNKASKSSKEQEIVNTAENKISSFPEETANKNTTHSPAAGKEIINKDESMESPTTNKIISRNCKADIIPSDESEIIVNGSITNPPATEEGNFNQEQIKFALEEEELNKKTISVIGSCDAPSKSNGLEEIKRNIQNDSTECRSFEQSIFKCQQCRYEDAVEREPDHSHSTVIPPSLNASELEDSSILPKENDDEHNESNDIGYSIDSPSLISTATIIFKMPISNNSPPYSPTTEEGNELFSNNLPQEVQEDMGYSLQAETNDIAESTGNVELKFSQSNKVTEWAEVQCLVKDSLHDKTFSRHEVNVTDSVIITGPTNENECMSHFLEFQNFEKNIEDKGDKDDTASESTIIYLEKDHDLMIEQNQLKRETNAETSFNTLSPSSEDPLTDGPLGLKVVDIHNSDVCAIEMDKDSPVADKRTPCPVNASKEDDGIGSSGSSGNSSDCNDSNKSGPSATIDAYLKLQLAEADLEQAASRSMV